jgi:hypothetical protein
VSAEAPRANRTLRWLEASGEVTVDGVTVDEVTVDEVTVDEVTVDGVTADVCALSGFLLDW